MTDRLSAPLDPFKDRELEILKLMAEGRSNQDIADCLFIAKETVRWYNKQIYSKLGTSRRTEAIAIAREMGLIGTDQSSTSTDHRNRHTLPITTGPFIGRDDELVELSDLLHKPDVRLLSIIAAGGMGKSRLSLELGHLVKGNYEHGACFIDLTPIRDANTIAGVAISGLGLHARGNQTATETLFNYCRDKEILLIVDNFEHVLPAASLLADLLEVSPRVQIIATSREALKLRAETLFYLQPVTTHADSLFIEVATMMRPGITIQAEEQASIDRIVHLVGGSPLALTLAATWIDILSIAEIATEIETSLDFLSAEMDDMPERQRSIHAVIDPTWKRLGDQERHAFMWASVFRGGFTRELFQEVTDVSIRVIQNLMSRSLIMPGNGRRFDMHPLMRQYAREKLEMAGALLDAKSVHLQVYVEYAQKHADRMFDGDHYLEALDALEIEQDNFRAALDWALQGNNVDQGVELILANGEFWLARSRSLEAVVYVEKAIHLSDHPKLHYWHSAYLDRLGQIDRAIEAAHYLIEYGEDQHDQEIIAYGQNQLALMKGAITEARPLLELALLNALETENLHLIAECHSYLGLVSSDVEPSSHYHKALEIFEELGDLRGISRVTNNIAIQYYDGVDRQSEAKELMEYSLRLKRVIGDRAGEARRLTTLGMWAINEEDFETARERLAISRKICEELGEMDRLSYVLTTEAILHLRMMHLEQAQTTLEHSLQIHSTIKDYKGMVDIYGLLGHIHVLQKNFDEAHLSIARGIDIATREHSFLSMLTIAFANLLWHKGDLTACIPIVASLAQQDLRIYSSDKKIVTTYLLQPLIYRVQQHIGDEAWQHALSTTAGMSIEQTFEDLVVKPMDKHQPPTSA